MQNHWLSREKNLIYPKMLTRLLTSGVGSFLLLQILAPKFTLPQKDWNLSWKKKSIFQNILFWNLYLSTSIYYTTPLPNQKKKIGTFHGELRHCGNLRKVTVSLLLYETYRMASEAPVGQSFVRYSVEAVGEAILRGKKKQINVSDKYRFICHDSIFFSCNHFKL